MKYLMLNDIDCYKRAFKLSNTIWHIVLKWEWFEKQSVGLQWVRAIDSISANVAEGFGRYTKRGKIIFYRYSMGSVKESMDWNQKSYNRRLITIQEYSYIHQELLQLPKEIHQLIKYTNITLQQ